MTVRAKFYVSEKVKRSNHPSPDYPTQMFETIVLSPVITGSKENESFFEYTPSGKIELGIMNSGAASQLELGKEYYVDFTLATE